ncbi:MAG: hypothetical protein WA322_01845 [Pseudolabrys sp.]
MSEIEDLKKEVKALKDQVNPPPRPPSTRGPIDYTAGMSMPRSAMKAMVDASSSFMSDLRADAMKPNPITGGTNPGPQPQPQRRVGWIEPRPLEVPYIKEVDRLVDAQDAKDRAELALKLAQARMGKGDAG